MSGSPRAADSIDPSPPPDPGVVPRDVTQAVSERGIWLTAASVTRSTRGQRIALGLGLLTGLWLALQLFASVLTPFVAAAVIAYALDPPTSRLTKLGLPRGMSALLMILLALTAVLLFALLLYPLLLAQIGLLVYRIPQYAFLVQGWARGILTELQQNFGPELVNDRLRDLVSGQAASMLSILLSTVTGVIGSSFAIFNVLSLAVVTPVVGFYLLRDWPYVIRMVDSWLPVRYAMVLRAQAREADQVLSAWVRGQALCCLILALYYAVGLSMAGLDLGLIVGLTAGLLSFIPYVGSISGAVTSIGLALAQFPDWRGVAVVGGILVAGHILEGYIIYPRFLGDRVELPAVWVIFALFAGAAAFGFVGVMLAVPMAATIGVLCRFWLRRYLASPLYYDPPPK